MRWVDGLFLKITLIIPSILLIVRASSEDSFWKSRRTKRGFLSRSGICPNPLLNTNRRDARLNFFGVGYLLPGDEEPVCTISECLDDGDCTGDRKCCRNYCGAFVCTEALREPHPCELFSCPREKICKIHRVRCIDPLCPDLLSVTRPICVPGGSIYEMGKRSGIPHPQTPLERYLEIVSRRQMIPRPEVQYEPKEPYFKDPYVQPGDVFTF